jgi:hypothetical protein
MNERTRLRIAGSRRVPTRQCCEWQGYVKACALAASLKQQSGRPCYLAQVQRLQSKTYSALRQAKTALQIA